MKRAFLTLGAVLAFSAASAQINNEPGTGTTQNNLRPVQEENQSFRKTDVTHQRPASSAMSNTVPSQPNLTANPDAINSSNQNSRNTNTNNGNSNSSTNNSGQGTTQRP